MKRILFVGDLRPHTRTSQRALALQRLGHEVIGVSTVDPGQAPPSSRRAPLLARLHHRLGRPHDTTGANRAVREHLREGAFDVLWVEKGQTLRAATLECAEAIRPDMQRAFFSEDDMTLASNQSAWFRASLPLYDLVFTTKEHNAQAEELPALGARRVMVVSKSFDPVLHRPVEVTEEDRVAFGAPIGFIGTFEEPRARALLSLARSGLEVRVWGNGWSAWRGRHSRLAIEDRAIYGEDYVRALCATDVNLGFLRKASRDRHTDRSVEIPACGAFLLAERTQEHLGLFAEGREAEYFGDMLELTGKVHRYLDSASQRREVAARARERCLRDDYSHDAVLRRMLEALDETPEARSAA